MGSLKLILFVLTPFLIGCGLNETPDEIDIDKNTAPFIIPVPSVITEASGIADSKENPGYVWVHEDGGNPPQLYLLGHNGMLAKTIVLKGATNRDWEDMALSGNDLYIADIGDNNSKFETYSIYKFREPSVAIDTVKNYETIKFRYPDGSHDSEAFIVDPQNKDIFIITKRDIFAQIYKIPHTNNAKIITAERVGAMNYTGVVSAAIAPDGKKIIIKTYGGIFYYPRIGNETIDKSLQRISITLPYLKEPQGEAVAFSVQSDGYFTISEKASSPVVNLYFYKL